VLTDAIAWLCRSPRRLVVSAAVLIAVVLIGGSALFGDGAGGTGGDTAGTSDTTTTAPQAQVPSADPYVGAAVAFVEQWSRLKSGETASGWQARVLPLATPELAEALKTTDPANLPGVGPEGEPVVRFVSQTSGLIAVPLSDGSSVLVTVVIDGQQPLVSDIQPNVGD
jgi:hypothetical protein